MKDKKGTPMLAQHKITVSEAVMGLLGKIGKAVKSPKRAIAIICEKYLLNYNGVSYDFFKNGEANVLKQLSPFEIKVIFDVGSNVGDWASIANKYFKQAEIHCFELSKKTFKTLSKNANGKQYVLNNIGLSNISGKITYKDYGFNSGLNTILLEANFHDRDIKPDLTEGIVLTGDHYCIEKNIDRIDFLKIDVEGAEHLVLEGFSKYLKNNMIRIIQFEYGYTNGDAKFLMKDFYKLFEGYGYKVGKIRPKGVEFEEWTYRHNDFDSGPNYIAVVNTNKEIIEALSSK